MAIGRKGSRRIVVDGTTYRWRLRRRPTYVAITSALAQGWNPKSPGSPFHLDQSDGFVSRP